MHTDPVQIEKIHNIGLVKVEKYFNSVVDMSFDDGVSSLNEATDSYSSVLLLARHNPLATLRGGGFLLQYCLK